MKKYIITENQLKVLKKRLLSEKVRSYVFDWDDNILKMPTKIRMDKQVDGEWIPVEVTTEEFATVRNNPNYRIKKDSFNDFIDNNKFIIDVNKAIDSKEFAPSFKKLSEALMYANNFAINTARGHSPETIKQGVKIFIDRVLNDEEKRIMILNIKKTLPKELIKNLNDKQLIDLYLDEKGEYYPVSSKEFGERFKIHSVGSSVNPEHSKQIAIEHFVKKLVNGVKKHLVNGKYNKISLGFSDDDIKNVKSVENFINNELKKLYPEVHFVIYDTSSGGKKKIVIEKD